MTSKENCSHIDAITSVKHAKPRECAECVKTGARGFSELAAFPEPLFGVRRSGSAALLAMAMTLLGTLRPAVRASIDPAVTLRAE
jgi:hypothetical protein